jgi:hypothetical protein
VIDLVLHFVENEMRPLTYASVKALCQMGVVTPYILHITVASSDLQKEEMSEIEKKRK